MKTVFGIGLLFFQLFIPFIVLTVCYGKILWILTRRINTDLMKTRPVMGNSEHINEPIPNAKIVQEETNIVKDNFQLARRNTIKTLLIVGLCFIICWSQNQVRYLMHNCGYELDFNSTYHQFTILMGFLNCTVNPFVYLIKYRDYQEAFRNFFHCKKWTGRLQHFNGVFPIFSLKSKIFFSKVKQLATSCIRELDTTAMQARHMWVIFKLNPIHASVVYQILWNRRTRWIQWNFFCTKLLVVSISNSTMSSRA